MPFPHLAYVERLEDDEEMFRLLQAYAEEQQVRELAKRLPSASQGDVTRVSFDEQSRREMEEFIDRQDRITAAVAPAIMLGGPGVATVRGIAQQVGDGIRRVQHSANPAKDVVWPRRLRHGADPTKVDAAAQSFGMGLHSYNELMDILSLVGERSGGR